MSQFRKTNSFIILSVILVLVPLIVSCTSKRPPTVNEFEISNVYSVYSTPTIAAITVKSIEESSDQFYILYNSSNTTSSERMKSRDLTLDGLYVLETRYGST